MSDWRNDPLTGRSVRIARERSARPNDFGAEKTARRCPFCLGSEDDTPAETARVDGSDGWITRVVPNLFPVVNEEAGRHEVVIESPRHVTRFTDLTREEQTAAVTMWASRATHWLDHPDFGYALVFKNEGPAAGASLEHVHSQVIALPRPPESIERLWDRLGADRRPPGESIAANSGVEYVSPPAPRCGYETWLAPLAGGPDLASLANDADAAGVLAVELSRLLQAIAQAGGPDSFNLVLQAAPAAYHSRRWWLEVVPRDGAVAGFELATGAWINSVGPEDAATRLAELLG